MGAKSRGNWASGMCLKDCTHQGVDDICSGCIRFSNLNAKDPYKYSEDDYDKLPSYGRESMRFKPHYNNAFGKFIHTKGDLLS